MSNPNAAFSKLRPDFHGGDRALKVLREHLKACGLSDTIRSALEDRAPVKEVRLPGFDLFSVGARSPFEWIVPKPQDEERLLQVYEDYVDQELGVKKAPERVAKRLYGDYKVAKKYFGASPRDARFWYTPAVKIIAAAQHFGCVVERRGHTVSTALLGYTMLVSPTGYHSNFRRATVAAATSAGDCLPNELVVSSLSTKHRLAAALRAAGADDAALWAANTIVRAESYGLIDTKDLFPPERATDWSMSAATKARKRELIEAAVVEASEIAQNAAQPILALYEVMVPTICNAQTFKTLFGHPWVEPDRVPRPETRTAWLTRIENLSVEALHALA